MDILRKIWNLYSVKIILALGISLAIAKASKINLLGGTILVCLIGYYLIHSFRDPAFKVKKPVIRVLLYVILVELLLAGFVIMSASPDRASASIRGQINSSILK